MLAPIISVSENVDLFKCKKNQFLKKQNANIM